jgi:hypothetical protein
MTRTWGIILAVLLDGGSVWSSKQQRRMAWINAATTRVNPTQQQVRISTLNAMEEAGLIRAEASGPSDTTWVLVR